MEEEEAQNFLNLLLDFKNQDSVFIIFSLSIASLTGDVWVPIWFYMGWVFQGPTLPPTATGPQGWSRCSSSRLVDAL